jgi:hypothetical protein
MSAGDKIWIRGRQFTVSAITDDTHLTLSAAWVGETVGGQFAFRAADTVLYRGASGEIRSNAKLTITGGAGSKSALSFSSSAANTGINFGGNNCNLYRTNGNQLQSDACIIGKGLTPLVKAGVVSDSDFAAAPPVGTIAYDSTNEKIGVRTSSGAWKWTAALA